MDIKRYENVVYQAQSAIYSITNVFSPAASNSGLMSSAQAHATAASKALGVGTLAAAGLNALRLPRRRSLRPSVSYIHLTLPTIRPA